MDSLYSSIHYWLVDQPLVSQFEWKQGHTFASTTLFLTLTVLTYLTLTYALNRFPLLPTLSPNTLRLVTAAHNLILCLASLVMAVGCTLSTLHQMPHNDWTWAVCFPANNTPPRGPTFFWAQVFYLSKILEFIDTLLIILSGSRSRRLSFLHVYHHAVVVIMCHLWLSTSQTLFPVALVTNASVHVLMYAYYLLAALGQRPRWKRLVTDCQIIQFVFSFGISGLMLYYHFTGLGCSGMLGWCFNAVFNASLLYLFVDFHSKNYANKKKQ
ncbi:putative elongation of fatty acids protein DDB_G0272012 [Coffea eugenioides]|uniref:very-long-chain 3-oxoacyl-CoA synthase n=1 Tax=Coffea arabica TaxID=13443 RepID=A0ABM4WVP6_COFAR|nr:putative elongation of fatty acids protein DDB_G0272012 [Coffea arabica]XP_027159759.1 putative elongation of fatty acids protein DDB_G0272012 [Coffea eugenioides]